VKGPAAPISGEETEKSHTEQGPGCAVGAAHNRCFLGLNIGQQLSKREGVHYRGVGANEMDAAQGVFVGCVRPGSSNCHVILPSNCCMRGHFMLVNQSTAVEEGNHHYLSADLTTLAFFGVGDESDLQTVLACLLSES
jgi:hypothetical protein